VVSFRVEALGDLQNSSWAIFDTVAAPFAPVFYDIDDPFGNDDLFCIQGNAPELHLLTSSNAINRGANVFLKYQAIL